MNRSRYYIALFCSLVYLGFCQFIAAQEADSLLPLPLIREKLELATDRTIYGSGDAILFRVYNQSPDPLKEVGWSKVVYVELLNSNNEAVSRGKFKLSDEGAYGMLSISDTVSSGICILRAYTRWMRNFPASEYAYKALLIINPHNQGKELLPKEGEEIASILASTDRISLLPDQPLYGKREKISLKLKCSDEGLFMRDMSLSVVRKGYWIEDSLWGVRSPETVALSSEAVGNQRILRYIPETRGISINGRVIRNDSVRSPEFTSLHLTILGYRPDYLGFVSDARGYFQFSLPQHVGARDILIIAGPYGSSGYELELDSEYSDKVIPEEIWPGDTLPFSRELLEEVMLQTQLKKAFASEQSSINDIPFNGPALPFYEIPEMRFHTEDYVKLPNLEEFFFEVMPYLQVEGQKGSRFLTVLGENGPVSVFPPLLMIDHLPEPDIERVLALSPSLIDSIDLVQHEYVRGSNIYGGIISIYSKEGNRAGLPLPPNAHLIPFSTFYPVSTSSLVEVFTGDHSSTQIPDLRPTLYWIPGVECNSGSDLMIFPGSGNST